MTDMASAMWAVKGYCFSITPFITEDGAANRLTVDVVGPRGNQAEPRHWGFDFDSTDRAGFTFVTNPRKFAEDLIAFLDEHPEV